MDPQLLDYYNRELVYMRELAGEFASHHPKVAKRLGMHGHEVADPYVERLIEAFCFLSARTQIKLDAEFPRFTQRLLEVVYPNYVTPTPAMAVAQFHPSEKQGDFARGVIVPRGTTLKASIPDGETTACEFRTTQDVQLWPFEIAEARLTGIPPDIPGLERYVPAHITVQGALRLRLRIKRDITFGQLPPVGSLAVYLRGDEQIASHLFELIHSAGAASLIGQPGAMGNRPSAIHQNAVSLVGFAPTESALPLAWNKFHGHNLVHEYFSCPQRFYFFALNGLAPGLSRIDGSEAEIVVLLSKSPDQLAAHVDASHFSLYCTPIVNLFPKRTDRIEIQPGRSEFHMVPDRTLPLDFEIYSVQKIYGQKAEHSETVDFRPLFATLNGDEGNHGRYFSVRRERRLASDQARKYGTRTAYVGTEVFLSLVDQNEAPYPDSLRHLSVEALVTNRDLPSLIPRNGRDDLRAPDSAPVASVGLIRPLSAPRAPFAEGEMAWRLIRQLRFNYLSLTDLGHREGGQGLRDMLRLFVASDNAIQQRQIASLIGTQVRPVTRRLPGNGPIIYGRGVQCQLSVDEAGFSGISPYLFGVVLEHFLARHVSVNSFTQTELTSIQRGRVHRWPLRMGTRSTV
ncbi:type VI secretion system baseplate subunit TssF [Ralstonia wenshanensis]|uniref:type VI secretion system baseplate subunit TssF n=1 Tax=Ralstonia wenshanensis TaxID=2842456 RepID=UPI0021B1BE19|nr:type VI secretion system baseplate subunit TssF [Ralstonia wenshanensis]MCT7306438.1 type VI secretion system baseplate subunit TssF [Ralstonia wenshanensis]